MTAWRKKRMTVEEWGALQDRFGELQMLIRGNPDLAMFSEHVPGDVEETIFITGPGIEAIEAYSPGGWDDSERPSGTHLSLLVGSGDPWQHFGIEPPAF